MRVKRSERGAALLAVLVLVAITGAIAAASLEKLRLSRALAGNVVAVDQARHFAMAAEQLALLIVDDLVTQNRSRTSLAGGWNGGVRRVPMPGGGLIEARLRDGGNCFNVNSVVEGSPRINLRRRQTGVDQFVGLMLLRGVPEPDAVRIAEAAADWADTDGDPSPGGAEDGAYAAGAQPYRTGNTLFADPSELRVLTGMRPEYYGRLRPYLCALPSAELSPININTLLPAQAVLIAMLAPRQLSEERARQLLASRPEGGWPQTTDFWRDDRLAGLAIPPDGRQQLGLRTEWFAIEVRALVDRIEFHQSTLVDARLSPSRLAQRRWERDPVMATLDMPPLRP
jgi:general secretion pathway protein K